MRTKSEYVSKRLAQAHRDSGPRKWSRPKVAPPPILHPPARAQYYGRVPRLGVLPPLSLVDSMHADSWSPPDVRVLRIEELLALQPIDSRAHRPGVYFLFLGMVLAYVGSSRDVRARVSEHDRSMSRPGRQSIRFDRATYLPVPHPWQLAIEVLYIQAFRPSRNGVMVEC